MILRKYTSDGVCWDRIELGDCYRNNADLFISHWHHLADDPEIAETYENVTLEASWPELPNDTAFAARLWLY